MNDEIKNIKEEGDAPGNVTANIDGYNTKYAFSNNEKERKNKIKKVATQYGYSLVKNKKKTNFVKLESTFKRMANILFLSETESKG